MPIDQMTARRIAETPIHLTGPIPPSPAFYELGELRVPGEAEIRFDASFRSTITFRAEFQFFEALARPHIPGRIVHDDRVANVVAMDEAWRAEKVISFSHGVHDSAGAAPIALVQARAASIYVPGTYDEFSGHHMRLITRGGIADGAWDALGHHFEVFTIDKTRSIQGVLITDQSSLSEIESDALWNALCLIQGCLVQPLTEEHYDPDGNLLQRRYRRGIDPTDERYQLFRYAPVGVQQLTRIHEAFHSMLRSDFNIARVLGHLFQPSDGYLDHEALHLVIACHTALAEWGDFWKRVAQTNDPVGARAREALNRRGVIILKSDYKPLLQSLRVVLTEVLKAVTIPERLTNSLFNAIERANDRSMGERVVAFLREDLGMTVDKDDERALGYRNELAHDGGFAVEFLELTYNQRNVRLEDVARLRNIANEMVLRLCGFEGALDDFRVPGKTRQIVETPASPF